MSQHLTTLCLFFFFFKPSGHPKSSRCTQAPKWASFHVYKEELIPHPWPHEVCQTHRRYFMYINHPWLHDPMFAGRKLHSALRSGDFCSEANTSTTSQEFDECALSIVNARWVLKDGTRRPEPWEEEQAGCRRGRRKEPQERVWREADGNHSYLLGRKEKPDTASWAMELQRQAQSLLATPGGWSHHSRSLWGWVYLRGLAVCQGLGLFLLLAVYLLATFLLTAQPGEWREQEGRLISVHLASCLII